MRVAVPGPLTGPRAAYGELIRKAVENLGVLPNLDTRFFDDKADPTAAERVAKEIVNDSIDVVVGHFNSDCARSAIPIYHAAGMPLLLPASTAPGLADGQSVFRLCADESRQAETIVAFLRETLQDCKPYIWIDGSIYGSRLRNQIETVFGGVLPSAPQSDNITAARNAVVVYCGTHVSILERFAAEGAQWPAHRICCDDCFVEEFVSQARPGTWVCAPHLDYGRLTQEAIIIAYNVLIQQTARWQDAFDASGESRNAAFRMHQVD